MLLLLLCLLGLATAVIEPPSVPHTGPTLDHLKQLTEALESELQLLGEDISDATTMAAVAGDGLNNIEDAFLPANNVQNDQQNALIADSKPQITALQDRVSSVLSDMAESTVLAGRTADAVAGQSATLDDIGVEQTNQTTSANVMNSDVNQMAQDFLDNVQGHLNTLNQALSNNQINLNGLSDAVMNKKCEHGTVTVAPGEMTISFKTSFTEVPIVAMSTTGFSSNMDIHSYDKYDILASSKEITNITTSGFAIVATDLSDGVVEFKEVFCSWVACQGLSFDFSMS